MPAPKPASVIVHELSKRYGSVEALRNATFEVRTGEIFGLLGPNGSGKTTALECILGLRIPDSGSVAIGGVDVLAHPKLARQHVGAQIQAATLQDRITPRRALGLFSSFYDDHAPVDGLLDRFGLLGKAEAPFLALSAGQRQRLFLAIAFVNNPSVVILDEPTAGLDPRSRRDLHEIIAGIRESGRTVLLSTHDVDEAQRLCDRVGILDGGRIIAAAAPSELMAASRSDPTIAVRLAREIDGSHLERLPGVSSCRRQGGAWLLATASVNETIAGLVRCAEAEGNELVDLRVIRPSLEDVYLSLTGQSWSSVKGDEE
jgi:ABC-2 type transport system ATP-binding protein